MRRRRTLFWSQENFLVPVSFVFAKLKSLMPERFGTRVMLMTIALMTVITVLIAVLVEKQGIDMLLEEKQAKLFALAHILNVELGSTFDAVDTVTPREQQVERLNQALSPRAEALLADIPKVGAGYYNKALDAIIVYAPERESGTTVGRRIASDHPGRIVMAKGLPMVQSGKQVRGEIMNAMLPIVRNGEVRGYIWANELLDDIARQTWALDKNVILVCLFGLAISVALATWLSRRLNRDIGVIRQGLQHLTFNLKYKLPPVPSELNEISTGVNRLATELSGLRTLNELVLESTVDGIMTIDTHSIITTLNPAAQKMTGFTLEQAVGKPYREIVDEPDFQGPLLDTLHNGVDHVGVEVDFPVGGKIFRISSSTNSLRDSSGQVIGAVAIFKDITGQKEMQALMAQAERLAALGELMAGVAHEIRNPLAAVRGFVQCLQQDDLSAAEKNEYIAVVLKEVDSINRVIQQLLELARPSRNYFSLTRLNLLVRDAVALVRSARSATASIRFELQLDESLPDIYLDREMIKQVLLNLLINAVQAVDGTAGRITVTTRSEDDGQQQVVEVADNGQGIADAIRSRLFTPFFTTKAAGTGIGLAMAQKIVTSHSGRINIDNGAYGGAVVVMRLPASSAFVNEHSS